MAERSDEQLKVILNFVINELNDVLTDLTESELTRMLDFELSGKKRPYVVRRVYSRYNRLRANRELKELLHGIS